MPMSDRLQNNDVLRGEPSKMDVKLKRRVLLIGGSKGIGAAVLNSLQACDHRIAVMNRGTGLYSLDFTMPENTIRFHIKQTLTHWDSLDALVVCAGMGAYHSPTVGDEEITRLFRVNVLGPQAVFRACQKKLLKARGKAIFVTSTVARKPGSGGLSYYAATKGAMNSWIISEGRRQIKHGVGLCAVAPGFVNTPMTEEMATPLKDATVKAIPAGRYGEPYEIATMISDMVWWSNWCVAGQIYEASGGA
jgi:NAD(P)-dependent dehydrogenase (short-subunit alcohol dehydrogenase family)